MSDGDDIRDLIAAWLEAKRASDPLAPTHQRRLYDTLAQFPVITLPIALADTSRSASDPEIYIEHLKLWPIEGVAGPTPDANSLVILPLHGETEIEGIREVIAESLECAMALYRAEMGAKALRHVVAVPFLIGDVPTESDQLAGHFDGHSMQASIILGFLSWLVDRNPPPIFCLGPCEPSRWRVEYVHEKIHTVVRNNWNRCLIPAASLDADLLLALNGDGWQDVTKQDDDADREFINRESGQELSISTYTDANDLFPIWRRHAGLPSHADLTYLPSIELDALTDQPTFGDLWRAALQVEPSRRRVPLSPFKLSKLLRSLYYADVGIDTWNLTDLQLNVWRRMRDATTKVNTNPFDASQHIILAGPTSCGKTSVAELLMISATLQNRESRCVLYVAPTKALTQAVHKALIEHYSQSGLFDDHFGRPIILSTGEDVADDWRFQKGSFSIACLVYEKANVLVSIAPELLSNLGMVVIDECHMLTEEERGPLLDTFLAKIQLEHERRERTATVDTVRIVAISTESADENADPNMVKLLTYQSLDLKLILPMIIVSRERPVPVTHTLVLESLDRSLGIYRTVDVKTFRSNDARILNEAELQRLDRTIKTEAFATRPAPDNGFQQVRGRQEAQDRLLDLVEDLIRDDPDGRRILLFISSKQHIYELAARLKKKLARIVDREPNETLREIFRELRDEIEDEVALKELLNWAESGILVHHGSLDQRIRHQVERICGTTPTGNSQILLATETLSFGVNLWITDVVLLGTKFFSAPRNRAEMGASKPVEIWEFHNMIGRAGRLSKTNPDKPARVFILPWSGDDATQSVIRKYYSNVESIQSKIFLPAEKALRAEAEFKDITADKFSHPFLRSVLDALRHTAFSSEAGRLSDVQEIGVAVPDLLRFFEHTLFGRTTGFLRKRRKDTTSEFVQGPEAKVFQETCELALSACARLSEGSAHSGPLQLVKEIRETAPASTTYAITEEGEAIIDTGVEVRTVIPLLTVVDRVRKLWADVDDGARPFPIEIYLLCIIAQQEGHGSVISDLPEFQSSDAWAKPHHVVQNSRLVLRNLSLSLERILRRQRTLYPIDLGSRATKQSASPDVASKLAEGLRAVLADHPVVAELRRRKTQKSQYDLGAVDSFIRLFDAMIAWIEGDPYGEVRHHLEDVPMALGFSVRFQKPLGVYAEFLSWKVECLTRLLAARSRVAADKAANQGNNQDDGQIASASGATGRNMRIVEQLGLRSLVWRLRLGCQSEGIPMLIRRRPDIARRDVTELLSNGVTGVKVLNDREVFTRLQKDLSRQTTKSSVRYEVQTYAVSQFRGLAQSFSVGRLVDPKPGVVAAANLWAWLARTGFPTAVEQYRLPTRGQALANEVWTALSESFGEDLPRPSIGATSAKLASSINFVSADDDRRTYKLSISREVGSNQGISMAEHSTPMYGLEEPEPVIDRVLKLVFVGMRDDWSSQVTYGKWEPISEILEREKEVQHLALIPAPWLPSIDTCPDKARQLLLARRADVEKRTVLFTLPAFAVFMTILGREFLRPGMCLDQVLQSSFSQMISIHSLLDILELSPHFPQPLRDALMRYAPVEVKDRWPLD